MTIKIRNGNWRVACVSAIVVAAAILSGCSIKKPAMPTWDTTLTIPLINRSYSPQELFDKLASDNIKNDSLGNSYLSIHENLDTVSLSSVLKIDDFQDSFGRQVGKIRIVTPSSQYLQLALADYIPLSAGAVPDTGVTTTVSLSQPSTFSSAEISDGGVILQIANNTGFVIDAFSGELRSHATAALLGTVISSHPLSDGESFLDTLSLDGKTISDSYDLTIYFHTPGGLALSLENRNIDVTVGYTDPLYASSLTGQISQFSNGYSRKTLIPDDNHVVSALLSSGHLNFSITNSLPIDGEMSVTFPDVTQEGQPLSFTLQIHQGSTVSQKVNLSGWEIRPQDDSLTANVIATVYSSYGSNVTIDESDVFSVGYQIDNVKFSSISGVIAPAQVSIDNNIFHIDEPVGFDNVTLDLVQLSLQISNNSELSGAFDINLHGSNGHDFSLHGNLLPRAGGLPSITTLNSDGLAAFLTPIPEQITVSGSAHVGDGATTVNLSNTDYLFATVSLTAPMAFKLGEGTVYGDKSPVNVGDEISKHADRLQSGTLKATISNHLPIGASVAFYLSTDSSTVFVSPLAVIGPLGFDMAPVNEAGIATAETKRTNTITLTQDQLHAFENKKLFVAPLLEIQGTNNQVVHINASDYFQINGIVEISARIGGEDF